MWGPWIELEKGRYFGGMFYWSLTFDSESDATASFDIEIEYMQGTEKKLDRAMGPGEHTFKMGTCGGCKVKVRMRSHLLGQNVRIIARHP